MVGQRLRKIRQQTKLSQVQLSKIAHVDQSDISKIEREERAMTLKTAIALADALEISLDYITGRSDVPEINK